MKVAAIIAEYNPFHNGHKYLIDKCKETLDVDYVVIIMSGNFTQRGIPAICDKYVRAKMALYSGADLVLELPTIYATASAEYFAYAGVYIASKLGFIDYLVFGSECGDIDSLINIAKLLINEPSDYKAILQNNLRQGLSYPSARAKAIESMLGASNSAVLSDSNNTLGIEYIKALLRLNSSIKPYTFSRIGASHNDSTISGTLSSSTAIRKSILADSYDGIKDNLPEKALDLLYKNNILLYRNDFSFVMHYALLSNEDYKQYFDIDSDLAKRIRNNLSKYKDYESFIDLLKVKTYTHSHISRALLHILLNIRDDVNKKPGYTTLLGFKKSVKELLSHIESRDDFKVISKNANYKSILAGDENALCTFEIDILAHNLYESARLHKGAVDAKSLFTQSPVII